MPAPIASNLTYIAHCREDGADLDVSAATTKEIHFTKPVSGDVLEKSASFVTDGTNGQIKYKLTVAENDESGEWLAQPYVVIAGDAFYGDIESFTVKNNLNT